MLCSYTYPIALNTVAMPFSKVSLMYPNWNEPFWLTKYLTSTAVPSLLAEPLLRDMDIVKKRESSEALWDVTVALNL